MKPNDLVYVKSCGSIGCVVKQLRSFIRIQVGDVLVDVREKEVSLIDTSTCSKLSFVEWQNQTAENNPTEDIVIVGNKLKQYVGSGWVELRTITEDDLKIYTLIKF